MGRRDWLAGIESRVPWNPTICTIILESIKMVYRFIFFINDNKREALTNIIASHEYVVRFAVSGDDKQGVRESSRQYD